MSKVLLFVDNSNIFISTKHEADRREGRAARDQVRLHFDSMLELALAGRQLAKAFVVGSVPPEERAVWAGAIEPMRRQLLIGRRRPGAQDTQLAIDLHAVGVDHHAIKMQRKIERQG